MAFAISLKLVLNSESLFSSTEISISSSGNPEILIWETPSISLKSFSIFFEIFFSDNKSISFPLSEKIIVASCSSTLETTIGSISLGKEEILSMPFLTSIKISSMS